MHGTPIAISMFLAFSVYFAELKRQATRVVGMEIITVERKKIDLEISSLDEEDDDGLLGLLSVSTV
jgi:hypothetical protein